MKIQYIKPIFLLFFLFGLAQCGEQSGLSKNVSLLFVPDRPVVVKADLSRGDDDTITGPWFLMGSRVYNGSQNRLYLVNYDLKGATVRKGAMVDFEINLDPSVEPCDDRGYIAVLEAGDTYENLSSACDPTTPTSGVSGAGRYEQWYYQSLPESDNSIYSFNVTANGWFTDADDVPVERLYLSGFVTTQ